MPLVDIPFGGLNSLNASERIPHDLALDASDCIVDNNVIQGRNGYRSVTGGTIGSGTVQLLKRFRPSTTARTILVRGGQIYLITDPSSETATDGTSTLVGGGPYFDDTDLVSGVQLGAYFYIASNNSAKKWYRITPSYTIETISQLPQPSVPTVAYSSLAWVKVTSLSAPTGVSGGSKVDNYTDWHLVTPSVAGGGLYYTLGADADWTSYNWLAVAVAPHTQSDGGGSVSIAVATNSGSYEKIGEVYDTPGDDTPSIVFCNLNVLSNATRSAVRKIQFISNSTSTFQVGGWLAIPSAPGVGPQTYSVTFYDSTTGQESIPSTDQIITFSSDTISIPQYHSVRGRYASWYDDGNQSADPDVLSPNRCFNKAGGVAFPSRYEFATVPTFSGSIPSSAQYPSANTVRLWRITSTGKRLVKATTYAGGATTYSITDDTGNSTLSHQLYQPGGAPLPCVSLGATGNRLISVGDPDYPNRFAISGYVGFTKSSDPFPQFGTVNLTSADGWQADIAPAKAEQLVAVLDGDRSTYLLTNYACYVMPTQTPNSAVYKVFQRGAVGRQGAIWAEEALYWASSDGIYVAGNRSYQDELSLPIRSLYAHGYPQVVVSSWGIRTGTCFVSMAQST